jgi:uncharacterized membrane protein
VSSDGSTVILVFLTFVFLTVALASFVLWIWALVDVVKVPDDSKFRAGSKLIWVLVIVFTGVVGAIIYLAVGRPSPGSRPGGSAGYADPIQPPPPPPGALG